DGDMARRNPGLGPGYRSHEDLRAQPRPTRGRRAQVSSSGEGAARTRRTAQVRGGTGSGAEILFVFLLDHLDIGFELQRIRIEQLDLGERRARLLLLDARVEGAQPAEVAVELLRLLVVQEGVEQLRGIGMRRVL